MMPLRRRVRFFSVKSFSLLKYTSNVHATLTNNSRISGDDLTVKKRNTDISKTVKPQQVMPDTCYPEVGAELGGELAKTDISRIIDSFLSKEEVDNAALEKGLDETMCKHTKSSFKKFCLNKNNLSADLYITLCDIVRGYGHVLDLIPYFLKHALLVYPYIKYKEELHKIGDLTSPEVWYMLARSMKRKIIFHYGPTNSGKTYKALERFVEAEKGIYCSPLKLLAHEVFEKVNKRGVPCDLLTGEEHRKALDDGNEANHISCTVEMASTTKLYDVAVIDEIQMLQDISRGYAWTRAFLGIAASEIHLCGEAGALEYIQETAEKLGEEVECIKYKRLTKLFFENTAVENFKNIKEGDCIICFSKRELFKVANSLKQLNIDCAVIYGTLPPGTKIRQCQKFNDPQDKCNVLVATDAVGLGLNLNIRRIIFYSVRKLGTVISPSVALQIAGRAGRFNSRYDKGCVAAFRKGDVKILRELISSSTDPVTKAGLMPSIEQIETFSYYLPDLTFTELIDIFSSLCVLKDNFFMCTLTNFKRLAESIQHTQLSIKNLYIFSCAPVNSNSLMCETLFVKFAKKFSMNEPVTESFMKKFLNWPLKKSSLMSDLEKMEESFDCLDLYLWFGNRFPLVFPDSDSIRTLQVELDNLVAEVISDVAKLMKTTEEVTADLSNKTEDSLIQKGIITPVLLAKLKKEWMKEMNKKNLDKNSS